MRDMKDLMDRQNTFFRENRTKPEKFRREALSRLLRAVEERENEIYAALFEDLHKSEYEAYLTEIQMVKQEIKTSLKHLHRWMKPKRVGTPITHFPSSSRIYREPFGSVLILSPWNYPFQLCMVPLVGAIAGGNCAVVKPSRSSPHVAEVIHKIISEAFSEEYIACVSESISYDELLGQRYDLIFFTGSERVGKIVMEAASRHVTPVVLELGGKSPCIVDRTAPLDLAAKRIAWGKFLNAGQTCVAPDYVLVDRTVEKAFLEKLKEQIKALYGEALENPDYPKIINQHHFKRLSDYIDTCTDCWGGKTNPNSRQIEPTIFFRASFDDPIMQEEIFGPILPVIAYRDRNEMIDTVKRRPKPLALYLFSTDKLFTEQVMSEISFGGGCINDTVMHLANHHLPFGGVGGSGMGGYHGGYSFETFTHAKGILVGKPYLDLPFRYPPYREDQLRWVKRLTK
ncbi:aldehyde dehydrogenase [Massiliimalia massiliensis]|uniref:aldehyde dehydrogenase n=1 Tax=Massiliimalia massiliensis TaxID=1852384 RepID=UPI0009852C1B